MSSIKLMLRLGALLFIAETAIMLGGTLLLDQNIADWGRTLAIALFDAFLLVLIAGFAIHYWALKPYLAVSRTRFPWTQNWLNRSVQGGPEHDR